MELSRIETAMNTTVLHADQLTPAHLEAWDRWQRRDEAVASPFFRPEYTQAVAAVRNDVRVAVLDEAGEPAGFFPFQCGRWGSGKPVGGRMTDFQGLVSRPGLAVDGGELLKACGLAAWDFDHLVASQAAFQPYHERTADSPFVDLSAGFEAYEAERARAGSQFVKQTQRKGRKLAREVGPLRFEAHTSAPDVLAALLRWKADQYVRTGAVNIFTYPWTVGLLDRVLAQATEAFAGRLSALYAGSHLVAAHLGLCSGGVLHWWFPTYDRNFAPYSPGLVLLLELARASAALGIRRIDLGKGEMDYKVRLMSGVTPVAEGSVSLAPLRRALRHGWQRTRAWVRSSSMGGPARLVGRWTRPLRGWLTFH
jgi:CelD/BcsL family acetyltransferase involved in cellulose biosynthesis